MIKKTLLVLAMFCISFASNSQDLKPVAQKIYDAALRNTEFSKAELFETNNSTRQKSSELISIAQHTTVLQFRHNATHDIIASKPSHLNFIIPLDPGTTMELQLLQSNIFTPDFRVTTSANNGQAVSYNGGIHYWGIIKGDNSSLAAISIFNDEVMGMISTANGNFILGKLENDSQGRHVIYNDKNLNATLPAQCFTPNDNETYSPSDLQQPSSFVMVNCIRLFWEVNNDIYTGKGSVANAANYVTGIFNQSAIIYANDGIPVELSEVFVWNTASPYTSTTSQGLLGQFQNFRNTINGDLGHLLGYAGGGGIAAGFSGLCSASLNNSQCYSGISSSYSNFPTYSWTVMVVTHEQGHLMGSRHTHACVWNGNNTAIDNCGPSAGYGYEGTCSGAPSPGGNGGTIMSYCHLIGGVGINFNNGFGTQPKNVILNNYNNAGCLTACLGMSCMPSANMSTASVGSSTATFNWAAVAGPTGYNIRYRIVGTGTWTNTTSATNSYGATGLTPGNNYEWQVQTVCNGGNSIFTISTNFTTTPFTCNTPTNLSTTNISSASATFNWGAVGGATGYNVRYRITGTGTWTTGASATTSFNASGLTFSSNYEWQVQTACSGGSNSSFSSSTNFTTSAPPCNFPQNLFTTNIASDSARFNWNSIPGAVSYDIRYRVTGTTIWTNASASSSLSYKATGLIPSSNYEWQVMTVCTGGQSAFSFSSLFTTLCVNPVKPGTITTQGGNTKVCPGDSKTYSISAVAGATSYTWTPPPGGVITNGQGTVSIQVNYTAGFVSNDSLRVVANNSCGSSVIRALSIKRNNPATPAVITGPNFGICNLTGVGYSTTAVAGMTYNWNFNGANAIVTSGQGTNSITVNYNAAYTLDTLRVAAGNACGISPVRKLTVKSIPATPLSISGNSSVCANEQNVPYSISSVASAIDYRWVGPTGSHISDGITTSTGNSLTTTATNVIVDYGGTSGILKVRANNSCGSGAYRNVTINFVCRESEPVPANIGIDISLYPNPSSGDFIFGFKNTNGESISIEITDVIGNRILFEKVKGSEFHVLNAKLQPGVYSALITCGNNRKVLKLIKTD